MASTFFIVDRPTIAADRSTLIALQSLSDYQPINAAYNLATLIQLEITLRQAEQAEEQLREALAEARRVRIATACAFHKGVLGAKTQVLAQYGDDSYELRMIGLTRKSDRRRPTHAAPATIAE